MFELIDQNLKLSLVILAPLFLAAGYFYRAREEKKKNLRSALYILLEIWHRMSIFYRNDFEGVFDAVFNEISKKFPEESIATEDISQIKEAFTPFLKQMVRANALSDIETYESLYEKAISLISTDRPVFAYRISSASSTRELLSSIQNYLNEALGNFEQAAEGDAAIFNELRSHMSEFAELDSLKDLERDILSLSFQISFYTYSQARKAISRRKAHLNELSNSGIKEMVSNVLVPVINEFNKSSNRDAVTGAPS